MEVREIPSLYGCSCLELHCFSNTKWQYIFLGQILVLRAPFAQENMLEAWCLPSRNNELQVVRDIKKLMKISLQSSKGF